MPLPLPARHALIKGMLGALKVIYLVVGLIVERSENGCCDLLKELPTTATVVIVSRISKSV
jgi:hypothetical protein